MSNLLVSLGVGLLFGLGLAVSGMTQPQKVIGFLDLFGDWEPTLMFVMVGAIGVHFFAYRYIKNGRSPILAANFRLPQVTTIDGRLILGSAIFGVGWGVGGYCPGPALTALVSLQPAAFVFVGTMCLGMLLQSWGQRRLQKPRAAS